MARVVNSLTYSVREAAEALGVSGAKMYQIIRMDGFPVIRCGGCLRVPIRGLEKWVDTMAEKGWDNPC